MNTACNQYVLHAISILLPQFHAVCIVPVKVTVFGVRKEKSNTVLSFKASVPHPKIFLNQSGRKEGSV
jgi:hypothetical protein